MFKKDLKALFDARKDQVRQLAPAVYAALYEGTPTQQLSVSSYYAAKSISGVSSFDDLFKSDDDISVGLTNLSNGKPAPGEIFLLCGIAIQYGVAAGTSDTNVKETAFGLLSTAMRNGEIEIAQNKRSILDRQSMEPFYVADHVTAVGDTNAAAATPITYTMTGFGNIGLIELDTPKWILPDQKIDVYLKLAAAAASNAAARIILFGVKNVKL